MIATDKRPDERIALITGSGRKRVGYVIAKQLAASGYGIAIHFYHSDETAHQNASEIEKLGVPVEVFQADLTQESEVQRLFADTMARFGRIDALINTSSIWRAKRLEEVTAANVLESFRVNTLGTFLCCQRAGRIMVEQEEGGSIITIGDWAIERPYLDHAAYFVSKGSIPTLTRTFAAELGQRNPKVRVNCIQPGPVMFPDAMSEEEKRATIEATLVKDANCPQTVALAVQFLIENKFVTGVCLPVDGGRSVFSPFE